MYNLPADITVWPADVGLKITKGFVRISAPPLFASTLDYVLGSMPSPRNRRIARGN